MRFLSLDDLKTVKGIRWCRETIWRKENEDPPRFPKRTHLGATTVAYVEPVIDEYVHAMAAGCDEVEATRLAERVRPSMPSEVKADRDAEHGEDAHATA